MMSGPAPVLAATAALGRTSSQPSLSTRTGMPVFSVNFLTFAMYASMSPWTKRLQRSTRSVAPFSGLKVPAACACTAGAQSAPAPPSPATAAAPADPSRNLRRLKEDSLITVSCLSRGVGKIVRSGGEPLAARGVEEVRACEVGHQADRAARSEVVPLAKDGGHVGAAVAA